DDRAGPRLIVGGIEAVVTPGTAGNKRIAGAAGVAEVLVPPHPAANLDASMGARDVEEPFAVKSADLHVFDGFGLDGEIGGLRRGNGEQTRRAAEEKALYRSH